MSDQSSSSVKWRLEGNQNFRKANAVGLAPLLKMEYMHKALNCYYRTMQEANGNPELMAAAAKNYAKASWILAKTVKKLDRDEKLYIFYYKEALSHFSKAAIFGERGKDLDWNRDLLSSYNECLLEALMVARASDKKKRIGYFESFSHVMQENNFKGYCFKEMATVLFHQGAEFLDKKDFRSSLYAFKECYLPIEELKLHAKSDEYLVQEATVLEKDVIMHTARAESLQALHTGDELLKKVLLEEEELNMDMVYTVIDIYKRAVILTRELEIEVEAIANSHIGKIYDQVLKIKHRARDYFRTSVALANTLTPRVMTTEAWYRVALEKLQKYQEETVQHQIEEEEKEKKKYLEELTEEIKNLKEANSSLKDWQFLLHVYKQFPCKDKNIKPPTTNELKKMELKEKKKAFQKAVIHYHPDKQDEEKYGKKWKVLSEEITKMLTRIYECYKCE